MQLEVKKILRSLKQQARKRSGESISEQQFAAAAISNDSFANFDTKETMYDLPQSSE